jgi:hypothetical protein
LRDFFALPEGHSGGTTMTRAIVVALGTGVLVSSAAALGIAGSTAPTQEDLTRQAYELAIQELQSTRSARTAACEALAATERDPCKAQILGFVMVREAEVEQAFRKTEQSARALQRARIEARYQVDRARCAAAGGSQRERCLVKAHASRGRALLQAAAPYESRM